jgi:hypothetical protein
MNMTKYERTTKAIRNLGNLLILKFIALNKISDNLKLMVSKSKTTHSQTIASNLPIKKSN